jgi:DNA oxidative demethylase
MSLLFPDVISCPLPGFTVFPDFIVPADEQDLLTWARLQNFNDFMMRGVKAKRRIVYYGSKNRYSNPETMPARPIPARLDTLKQLASEQSNLGSQQYDQALLTWYPEGAGIGWHRDAPVFGEYVFGFSLLSDVIMKFRKIDSHREVRKVLLPARSAYLLCGDARYKWQHSIACCPQERYSITFRQTL